MPWPNCDVCGKPAKGVCCSPFGPFSQAYCQECLDAKREPWNNLVGQLVGCSPQSVADWARPYIKATCEFFGKSEEQLWQEVEDLSAGYEKYLKGLEDVNSGDS